MEQLVSIRTRELGPDSAKTSPSATTSPPSMPGPSATTTPSKSSAPTSPASRPATTKRATRPLTTSTNSVNSPSIATARPMPSPTSSAPTALPPSPARRQARPRATRPRILLLLARAHLAHADSTAARPITAEWLTLHEAFFNLHLTYTSEADRLALLAHERPFDLPGALGDPAILARASLRLKGLVLDSLLEDQALARASADPAAACLLADYRAALASASASPHPASALDLSKLEQLERELARRALAPLAHRHALTADPAAVLVSSRRT